MPVSVFTVNKELSSPKKLNDCTRHQHHRAPQVEVERMRVYGTGHELTARREQTKLAPAVGLGCKRLLESFSSRATQSVTCFGLEMFLPIARAQSRAPPSSSARHATATHTSSSSTRLMLGSAAFTLAMSARATSSSAGVSRMAPIVAGTSEASKPRIRGAIPHADLTYKQKS